LSRRHITFILGDGNGRWLEQEWLVLRSPDELGEYVHCVGDRQKALDLWSSLADPSLWIYETDAEDVFADPREIEISRADFKTLQSA